MTTDVEATTDYELVARTPAAQLRDDYPNMARFADNMVQFGWDQGQKSMDDVALDFGLTATSFCEPQYRATATSGVTPTYHRDGAYPFFQDPQSGPVRVPYAPIIASSGDDRQADVEADEGWYTLWGYLDARSGAAQAGNRLQAWMYEATHGHPEAACFAESLMFVPRGSKGNGHNMWPVMPIWPLVATPADVVSGVIAHALPFGMAGRCALTTPIDTSRLVEPNDPAFGTKVAGSLSPATLVENTRTHATVLPIGQRAPEGMRLIFLNTDDEIEQLLDQAKVPAGQLRDTMRIFMVCLRDYGIWQTQTGGAGSLPCDGSPAAQSHWVHDLGVPAGKVLKLPPGTMRRDNVVGLIPPTSTKTVGGKTVSTKREMANADRCQYLPSDLKAAA